MHIVNILIIASVSYFLGSLSFAIIICKLTLGQDIRTYGSGNAGLTNSYRTMGAKKTLLVLVGDIAKAAVALAVGGALEGMMGKLVAGIFVITGHVFPVYFGFRGGKGVLVGATMLLFLDWRIFVVGFAIFITAVFITKWVSLGSILGAISVPFSMWIFYHDIKTTFITVCMAFAVVFMHRSNIVRILKGTENKFSFKSKPQIKNDDVKKRG